MLKLAAFDFDGVLADSEPLHQKAKEMLADKIGAFMRPDYARYVGRPNRDFWRDLLTTNNIKDLEIEELEQRQYDQIVELALAMKLKPTKGIETVLGYLEDRGVTLAVCSSSDRSYLERMLEILNLKPWFRHLVGGDEVAQRKPAPDVYLKALELTGTKSSEALAIEDSSAGVQAARSAGYTAIGYQNPASGRQDLSQAHLIIHKFESLNRFLKLMGQR